MIMLTGMRVFSFVFEWWPREKAQDAIVPGNQLRNSLQRMPASNGRLCGDGLNGVLQFRAYDVDLAFR